MPSRLSQPRSLYRAAGALVGVLAGFAAAAPHADASRMVYVCGEDLCAVNPDNGARAQITTDGVGNAYRFPSISLDGTRIAAARGSDVNVGDYGANLAARWTGSRDINEVALSPDGSAVGESHSYVQNVNRFRCTAFGDCGLVLVLEDFSESSYTRGAPPATAAATYRGGGGVSFLGNGALLSSYYTVARGDQPAHHAVCVVANPGVPDQPCDDRVTSPTPLNHPTGSPDSTLIAVALGDPAPATTTSVTLYDAATGSVVRKLADGAASPTFSPDGKQVGYAGGDGWIYVVPTGGGKATRLVQGASPSWGNGIGPGASVTSTKLNHRKGRIAIKLSCAGPVACTGNLRIAKSKSTLGRRTYTIKAGTTATVSVRPTSRGKKTIARAKKHTVTVQLTPTNGTTTSTKLPLRR